MKTLCTLFIGLLVSSALMAQNPPRQLQASLVDSNNVLLQWNAPLVGAPNELSWTTGVASGAIGLNSGGTYAIAARWEPAHLTAYNGFILQEFTFYQYLSASSCTLKIWKGANAATLVYIQPISDIPQTGWVTIPINSTIVLDASQEFWIGIEINQPANDFPASIDSGPAIVGFGDKINFQGIWENLSSYGIDANFTFKLMLYSAQGQSVALELPRAERTTYSTTGWIERQDFSPVRHEMLQGHGLQAMPDEYRIYRNQNLISTTPPTELSWIDTNLAPGSYNYAVTAAYGNNESAPSTAGILIGQPSYFIQPEQFIDSFPVYETVNRTITLFNNSNTALGWQAASSSSWIVAYPFDGLIPAGGSQVITLTFYTYGLNPGSYTRFINFTTSDPAFTNFSYRLDLTIFNQPLIYFYQSSLDFGNVSLGQTSTLPLELYNGGSDTLRLSNVVTNHPSFSLSGNSFIIPPYHAYSIAVSFTPQAMQAYNGDLSFSIDSYNNSYNIPLSGQGVLQPPLFLNARVQNGNDVRLDWLANATGDGSWINYCSDVYATSVGLMDGGTFRMAARWPAGSISSFAGQPLIRVAFYPGSQQASYTLKIWQGQQASSLLYSQSVIAFQPNQWNEIALNNPVIFDAGQDLWIGFEVVHQAGDYPGALAQGAPLPGLGDMVNTGAGWESLTSYGLPYNWMIKGLVAASPSSVPLSLPQPETALEHTHSASLISKKAETLHATEQGLTQINPVFQGFNLYRNRTLLNASLLQVNNFTDQGLADGIYTYGVAAVYDLGESNPLQRTVQIGGPVLSVNPSSITDTLAFGADKTYNLTFTNTGHSNLIWSAPELPYYLTLSGNSTNLIAPGQSSSVSLTLQTQFLYPGTFFFPVRLLTNNINDSVTEIQTLFRVEGSEVLLDFQYDTLDFGLVALNQYVQKQMTVTNLSNFPVYIYAYSDDINFQSYLMSWYLMPGEATQAVVSFSGNQTGIYNGNLIFQTYAGYDLFVFSVPMKAMIGFQPPSAFAAVVSEQTVELSWYPPGTNPNLLQYGNGEPYSSVGFASDGTLVAAIKFSPAELMAYAGKQLSSLEFYTWSSLPVFKARIYTGPNAENLIFEQMVSNPANGGWNSV